MLMYNSTREDYINHLVLKYNKYIMDYENYNWCLTLPMEFAEATDFKAEETIKLDWNIQLPKSFSLWEWVYSTNYQGSYGSCTANSTSHGVQILNVKAKWIKPINENLITPSWRDLWTKMWHDLKNYNDSWDYVEKAVKTALKMWIKNEEWWESNFDGYCTWEWEESNKWIETIKRYLYNWNPIIWCMRWNSVIWNELSKWQLKTVLPSSERKWGHAICLVGWDEWGLWFLNSFKTNDWKGLKSRFYATYDYLKSCKWMFNWRYWLPFKNEQAIKDAEYMKRKNVWVAVITQLKKTYPSESPKMQKAIEEFSRVYREEYPEINEEIPLKS